MDVVDQVEADIEAIEHEHPEYSHRDIILVFTALVSSIFVASLDNTIVATALPVITKDLGAFRHLAWVVTAYLLASTIGTPLWAKFGDLRGRKRLLQGTVLVFLLGSVLCGSARTLNELIGARFIQGLGGGGIIVMVQSTIAEIVPVKQRGRYQGYTQGTFAFASIAGPLIGGALVQSIGWRWIFFINLPIGAVAITLTQIRLKLPKRHIVAPIDYLGISLLIATLTTLVLYTVNVQAAFPFVSAKSFAIVLAIVLMFGLFLVQETRAQEPLLPLRLFENRTFVLSSLCMAAATCALFGSSIYIPVFNQTVRGFTPTISGLLMAPMMISMTAASTFSGKRLGQHGRYRGQSIFSMAAMAISLCAVALITPHTRPWEVCLLVAIFGIGYGPTVQVLIQAVQYSAPRRDLGIATGNAGLFRMLGGSIGTAVFGAIFAAGLTPDLVRQVTAGTTGSSTHLKSYAAQVHVTHAIGHVFIAASIVAALGCIAAIALPNRTLTDN
jgi:EmrB/QacA subfamily drug resistance transporter